MGGTVSLALAVTLSGGMLIGFLLLAVRRRRLRFDPDRKREAARRSIHKMARGRRRRSGTIRGEGLGGDQRTAHDAAFGSDFGGGI